MDVREASDRVEHPAILWDWTRVDTADHPQVRALYEGAPDLGWAADPRLCLYRNDVDATIALVRLEHDGEYRLVCRRQLTADERLAGDSLLDVQAIDRLIRHLIGIDTRRGFDALVYTETLNAEKQRRTDAAFAELVHEEISPRLVHAISREYLPGVDVLPRLR